MATSGTYANYPQTADLIREACERALINPSTLDWGRIESMLRSVNFALQKLGQSGAKAYEMELVTQVTSSGMVSFTAPQRCARILMATLSRDGIEVPLVPISRFDYEAIPKKDVEGRANQYFFDDSGLGTTANTVYIWPAGENDSDIVRMWILRRPVDANLLNEDIGLSQAWLDAFCDELSVRAAQKYNPAALTTCKQSADDSLKLVREHDRERAPVRFRMSQTAGRMRR
jgi:hypothetical protein